MSLNNPLVGGGGLFTSKIRAAPGFFLPIIVGSVDPIMDLAHFLNNYICILPGKIYTITVLKSESTADGQWRPLLSALVGGSSPRPRECGRVALIRSGTPNQRLGYSS